MHYIILIFQLCTLPSSVFLYSILFYSVLCFPFSSLSKCIHAAAALLYPFTWAHTYIPVVPEQLLSTVCCPTPFMVGIQKRYLEEVLDQPMEEVLSLSCVSFEWTRAQIVKASSEAASRIGIYDFSLSQLFPALLSL